MSPAVLISWSCSTLLAVCSPKISNPTDFNRRVGASATWFENSDQQALRQFEAGDYIEAAYGFSDPYRKGVALYRAGRYADAAKNFEVTEDPENRIEARYNLGNTRFQLADFAGAVTAFEQVLSADPTHSDAQHNLGVARAMLAQVEQEQFKEKEKEKQEKQEKLDAKDKSDEQQEKSKQDESKKDESKKDQSEQDKSEQQEGRPLPFRRRRAGRVLQG